MFIAEIGVRIASEATAKSLFLDISITEETPRYFRGDPLRLRDIIYYLACCSLNSTDSGGITIRISSHYYGVQDDRRLLQVDVTDTGQGFLPERVSTICQTTGQSCNLEQSDSITVGLTAARRLARLMGGNISVQSVYGWGTRYSATVYLTAAPSQQGLGFDKFPHFFDSTEKECKATEKS